MTLTTKETIPYLKWVTEVVEERIIEDSIIRKEFGSKDEFIIFSIIMVRVLRFLRTQIENDDKEYNLGFSSKKFYEQQKFEKHTGVTMRGIARESGIPRTTVSRIIDKLIAQKIIRKNINQLIIPTAKARDKLNVYRRYLFTSNKRLYDIFEMLDLKKLYSDEERF